MKDSETFKECCDNCPSYPCISIHNLDKLYGVDKGVSIDKLAKAITRQVGCRVYPPNPAPEMVKHEAGSARSGASSRFTDLI